MISAGGERGGAAPGGLMEATELWERSVRWDRDETDGVSELGPGILHPSATSSLKYCHHSRQPVTCCLCLQTRFHFLELYTNGIRAYVLPPACLFFCLFVFGLASFTQDNYLRSAPTVLSINSSFVFIHKKSSIRGPHRPLSLHLLINA